MRLIKKVFLLAAASTAWAVVAPAILSAQSSGVGSDGWTRFYYQGTDSSIYLWKVDSNLGNPVTKTYGPYDGWYPKAITVGSDNWTRILWRYTDGSIALWNVDGNFNYLSSKSYGPYPGWLAESISIEYPSNRLRVIWKETSGKLAVWVLDQNLNYITSQSYGPFFGYYYYDAKSPDAASQNAPAEMQRESAVPLPQ